MLTSPDATESGLLGNDVQLSPLEKGPLGDGGLGGAMSPSSTASSVVPLALPAKQEPSAMDKKRKRIRIGMGQCALSPHFFTCAFSPTSFKLFISLQVWEASWPGSVLGELAGAGGAEGA